MLDIIKKGMLVGVGAAVVTKEGAEKVLSGLVSKGKLTTAEAKETAEAIVGEGRKQYEETRDSLQESFDKMLRKAHVATQAELAALAKRVAELEAAVKAAEKPKTATKPAAEA